jgi:hypothetical protein
MRLLLVVAALSCALPAAAQVELPQLRLRTSILDVSQAVVGKTPSLVLPERYSWALDDGRAFWFAAGGSSVVALGTHVLVGLPTLVIATVPGGPASAAGDASPATRVPLLLGISSVYLVGEAAVAALAATLVFNGVSKIYRGNYLVSFSAHLAGAVLGAAVTALPFGTGGLLLGGLSALGEFTGGAGQGAILVFSVLGALPAVVIGAIALVGVPAVIGAWAMSVSAEPKEGYVIDPRWRDPAPVQGAAAPLLTIPLD